MTELDLVLADAVAERDVPFAVAMVTRSDGVTYSGAAGTAAEGRAAAEDTVFRIFSMTKAIGSTAAMILIDRGQLSLDTPVGDILPAWNDLQVIDGWDGDSPILRAPRVRATVRHLATHTSGIEYEFWSADTAKYLQQTGQPTILSGLEAALAYPLTSDPGTRWGYGISIDWLGRLVQEVDGRRIDQFCREEILDPLGMTDTAFEADGLADRMSDVSMRTPDGGFRPTKIAPPSHPELYGMGHALFSTAPDYIRFIRMILNDGQLEGNRILSSEAMRTMRADQMQGLTVPPMTSVAPPVSADVNLFPGIRTSHSFAFLRNDSDVPGKRSAGSLGWAGICNTHFWIDPARDLGAVLMTQSLPFAEPGLMKTYDSFERAVYARR